MAADLSPDRARLHALVDRFIDRLEECVPDGARLDTSGIITIVAADEGDGQGECEYAHAQYDTTRPHVQVGLLQTVLAET